MLSRVMMKVARHPASGALVGWIFAHLHALLPVRRLVSTRSVLAFCHPRPSWETHVLLVPKRRVHSLVELARPAELHLFAEILDAADAVVQKLGLAGTEHVLCANGGPRQEVGQVHFHLFAGKRYISTPDPTPSAIIYHEEDVVAYHHPAPDWEFHLVIQAGHPGAQVRLATAAAHLMRYMGLEQRGCTLVVANDSRGYGQCRSVHLISGGRQRKL